MRFIPTRVHGVIDYLWGADQGGAPWVLGFGSSWAEAMIPVALGLGAIFYSLVTDYECGVIGVLPMRWHLRADVAAGLFLAASPWLLDFANIVGAPHVAFGLFSVAAGLLTRTTPMRAAAPPESGDQRLQFLAVELNVVPERAEERGQVRVRLLQVCEPFERGG